MPTDDPAIVAGADWLLVHQQACGGWGESPDSYESPHLRGQGTPTASQTAWAILGLVAAGMERHPAVARGIRYLTVMQNDDGTWDEAEFTGTGFPRVFYLRYHYYRIYFPLLALSQWAVKVDPKEDKSETPAAVGFKCVVLSMIPVLSTEYGRSAELCVTALNLLDSVSAEQSCETASGFRSLISDP